MPEQLSQITIGCVGPPDPRKAVFHQPQQQLRILKIGLLLAHPLRANLGGILEPTRFHVSTEAMAALACCFHRSAFTAITMSHNSTGTSPMAEATAMYGINRRTASGGTR